MAESNKLHSINTSRVLRTIWQNPDVSRIKVAEMLGLDRSTVTKIIQSVLERDIVLTAGKREKQSGVGRRQVSLRVNTDIGVVLGLEIQTSHYRVVVTTIYGEVLHSFFGKFEANHENLITHAVSLINTAKKFIDDKNLFLLGIGIGVPGIVDPYTGIIIRSNPLNIQEPFDLKKELILHFDEYVFIENDANCCCWGELAFHPESRERNFLTVLGEFRYVVEGSKELRGLAMGLGLVVRERVLHGDHFTAGEYRSVYATSQTGQFIVPWSELCHIPEDKKILEDVYRELTTNLAFLVNTIDLTKIVFAGDIVDHPGNIKELMSKAIEDSWVYDLDRNFIIGFSEFGENSVSIGAAGLFIEKLFSVPDMADRFQELVGYDLYEYILTLKGRELE
ncbi:MAG TPA: ROK family transcriptional regulator [Treponema sp.]|nr:ROK family transcriptional regulator [Treponema sp.]